MTAKAAFEAGGLLSKRATLRPSPGGERRMLKEAQGKLNLIRSFEPWPFQVLCPNFTGVRYAGGTRKAHLRRIIESESAWVAGWAVGESGGRKLALRSWEAGKEGLADSCRDSQGSVDHRHQSTVYTNYRWLLRFLIEAKALIGSPFLDILGKFRQPMEKQEKPCSLNRQHLRLDHQSSIERVLNEGFLLRALAGNAVKSRYVSGTEPQEEGHS